MDVEQWLLSMGGGQTSLALIEAVFESRPPLKVKCLVMGKRVEIFDLVFPGLRVPYLLSGIYGLVGYFQVFWEYRVDPKCRNSRLGKISIEKKRFLSGIARIT